MIKNQQKFKSYVLSELNGLKTTQPILKTKDESIKPHIENIASDFVSQSIDQALQNHLNITAKLTQPPSVTYSKVLNQDAHPIDSNLKWRSKNVPTLTDEEKDRLMSLEQFCKSHNKQLFFGLGQCKQTFPNNAIWIDDASYSKAPAKTLDSTWINPINPKKSLDDLINEIKETTTCIYLDWDYGDNVEYDGGDVAKKIKEKQPNTPIILTSSPPSMDELQQRIATPHVDGLLVFDKNLDAILRLFKTTPFNTQNDDEETPSTNITPTLDVKKEFPKVQQNTDHIIPIEFQRTSTERQLKLLKPNIPHTVRPSFSSPNHGRKTFPSPSLIN